MSDNDKLLELYSKLKISEKREEMHEVLEKSAKAIESILKAHGIDQRISLRNYNDEFYKNVSEEDMMKYLYDDMWTLKNYLLMLEMLLKSDNNIIK